MCSSVGTWLSGEFTTPPEAAVIDQLEHERSLPGAWSASDEHPRAAGAQTFLHLPDQPVAPHEEGLGLWLRHLEEQGLQR